MQTLVNFTVTEFGLEDQLLGAVVSKERLDLEDQRADLINQQNLYTIRNAAVTRAAFVDSSHVVGMSFCAELFRCFVRP